MYVYSRSRHVNSATLRAGIGAALEGCNLVNSITELQFSVWTTFASPDVGLITWSAFLQSLQELEAAGQKLGGSTEWGDWYEANDNLFEGPSEDRLTQIIHGEPDMERTVNYVAVTSAVCANGKMGAALAAGVEIAEAASKITGNPILFGIGATGVYGRVAWLGASETIAESEQAQAALAMDPSWLSLVDQHGASFQAAAESSWYQRLG